MDIKIATWNIRGLSTSDKQDEVRKLISEEKLQVCAIIETHVKFPKVNKMGQVIFGNWEFVTNAENNNKGCRIMVGWNQNKVKAWLITKTKQNPKEHSNGSSKSSNDMVEFRSCVEELEIEDMLSSGFQFTWTKSLRNPNCRILKKLDRIMINEVFLDQYLDAHRRFHDDLDGLSGGSRLKADQRGVWVMVCRACITSREREGDEDEPGGGGEIPLAVVAVVWQDFVAGKDEE
ncbi:hypothetical protein CTI12_AA163190 [Artemisia annua]|uniref:RNA-directed DNA polymerase, eukaryota, Reverse transcriptase zinc-binding domain protein n=1 Tax=Artemisia annua TaxID=35608 RepID=A0A2U1PEA1_ARTAN|nr:hypothetical protein CTI12_AA163190 [Artemisia annua]